MVVVVRVGIGAAAAAAAVFVVVFNVVVAMSIVVAASIVLSHNDHRFLLASLYVSRARFCCVFSLAYTLSDLCFKNKKQ